MALWFWFVFPADSFSQLDTKVTRLLVDSLETSLARKNSVIYLQTSKDIFETGEDLWFKAYFADAQTLKPFALDTTLYIQLTPVDKSGEVIQEKFVIMDGFSEGRLYLPDTLEEGDYYLKAFSTSSFFNGQNDFKNLRRINIRKSIIPQIKIEAQFDRNVYVDGQQISLTLKLSSSSGALLPLTDINAVLNNDGQLLETLKLQTDYAGRAIITFKAGIPAAGSQVMIEVFNQKEGKSAARVMPVPYSKNKVHFYVFPEGGYLVAGLPNILAFKAVDVKGIPLEVSGTLLEDNKALSRFKSLHDGMGKIELRPIAGKQYRLRLDPPYSDSIYHVGEILPRGIVLHYKGPSTKDLVFKLYKSSANIPGTIYLRAQIRGKVFSMARAFLKDSLTIGLPAKEFPQGVAEVTLFGEDMMPLAERLVYVNTKSKLYITSQVLKPVLGLREKGSIKIKVTDELNNPVVAHFGVSIFDRLYRDPSNCKNILTHFYLDNQLKGDIYNPAYYFDDENSQSVAALDVLMLTQGWRRYIWNHMTPKMPDRATILSNSIHGNVTVVKQKKGTSGQFPVQLFAPDNKGYGRFTLLDSLGSVTIAPYDLASANNGYLYLKAMVAEEIKTDIKIVDPFELINNEIQVKKISYPIPEIVNINRTDEEIPVTSLWGRGITLKEVTIKEKGNQQFRDKYLGYLDSLTKADLIKDYVGTCGWLNCPAESGGPKPIEGKQYSTLIEPKRSQVISHPYAFGSGDFKQVVYHYPQFTEEELLKKQNMARLRGYSLPREFFHPDYENNISRLDPLPDFRNTLYWKSDLITDKKGEAVIDFYSSDLVSGFVCRIEGLSAEGLLGKKDIEFTVQK